MTEAQRDRVAVVKPDSMWRVPDGSWLVVRRDARGTWVEVMDPEATAVLALDFAADEQLVSRLPESEVPS
jgi:hypothetical protein